MIAIQTSTRRKPVGTFSIKRGWLRRRYRVIGGVLDVAPAQEDGTIRIELILENWREPNRLFSLFDSRETAEFLLDHATEPRMGSEFRGIVVEVEMTEPSGDDRRPVFRLGLYMMSGPRVVRLVRHHPSRAWLPA